MKRNDLSFRIVETDSDKALAKEIAEVKVGRKGILDLEEDLKFCQPQTFDFHQCAEALGRNLQERLEM